MEDPHRCPECRGTGKVLLLFSWATCPTCDGTGCVEEEDPEETGKFPVIRDDLGSNCGEGSKTGDCCDPEECPSYFDDGLEFLDEGIFGYDGEDEDPS